MLEHYLNSDQSIKVNQKSLCFYLLVGISTKFYLNLKYLNVKFEPLVRINYFKMSDSLSKLRARTYDYRMKTDRENKVYAAEFRLYLHSLLASITARCLLLGPLERIKLIHQVTPICKYINPSDRPTGTLDLIQKININQGVFAYYRGFNALCYKIAVTHFAAFCIFDELEKKIGTS